VPAYRKMVVACAEASCMACEERRRMACERERARACDRMEMAVGNAASGMARGRLE